MCAAYVAHIVHVVCVAYVVVVLRRRRLPETLFFSKVENPLRSTPGGPAAAPDALAVAGALGAGRGARELR